MADPLSIAGLVLQVGDIMIRVYEYGKRVKEAKEDMIRLHSDLVSLKEFFLTWNTRRTT
jgi:hypothetical protein